jgi:Carboxypeptidase regulatory-like domain
MEMQFTARSNARWKVLGCLFMCLLLTFSVSASWAQTTQQFTGHVLDSTGAAAPKALVVIHNQETGVDTKSTTTDVGVYTVPYLQPGTYTITASKDGFKTEEKTDIQLNIDQTSTIDFHLAVGAASEVVTVNSNSTQIELSKSDRGEIFDSERVNELPLDGRNPYELFTLSPGVHDFSNPAFPRPFDNVTNNFYANGAAQQPSLSLGGISNDTGQSSQAGYSTNPGLVPSVDAVQEFKVVLGAEDASYGRGGASSIDVALKSGTNQFHGILDYYKRGTWLDTYAWDNKWNALSQDLAPTKNQHNRNQFSLEFDGPVEIPHLFNGKHKLFFTASYEEMLEVLPSNGYSFYSIPNPDWVNGDFSSAQYWNSTTQSLQPLGIYDPLTPLQTFVDPNDGITKTAHSQFPGNKIPTNRIDPVGQAILNYLVQVKPNNNPGPGYAPYTNNWRSLVSESDIWRNALIKVDYDVSSADRISFRWAAQGRWSNGTNITSYPNAVPFNVNGGGTQPKSETGAIEWTHTFSPNLLFDLHAELMTQENNSVWGPNTGDMLEKLGFASAFYSQVQNKNRFPYVSFDGLPNSAGGLMGYTNDGTSFYTHALDFLPTLTWIHGEHTIRAGFDVQLQQADNPYGGNNDGFEFGSGWTNEFFNYPNAPGYSTGASWASALLGYPESGTVNYDLHTFEWQPYYAPWVQDDWKVTNKLTLNLGFRWDFQVPRVLRGNQMDGIFNTSAINSVSASLPFAVLGGTEFAGVNGQPRSAFAMNWFDLQPRIGFAYAFRSNLSLRGFVAKNYQIDASTNGNAGFATSTNYVPSLDGGLTPYTATTGQGLSNPFQAVTQPTGASLGYLTSLGNGFTFYNPRYHIPQFWNYNLTLEAAVTKHDVVSIGYVGNIVPDGPVTDNINHPSAAFYQQCNGEAVGWASDPRLICDNQSASNTQGFEPNPFQGVAAFAGSGYYGPALISKADPTRPYFGWWDINEVGANYNARAWYNSFQATVKHQLSNNLSLFFNYAHATDMNAGSYLDTTYRIISRQVNTTNQVKHAINFSGVVYLPFGRGRVLFSHANPWLDEAINGWEISPLMSYYSGFPWRPSGTWEWNTNAPMGVSHVTLPVDGMHNYQRIRGVTPCVGYINSDTGAVIQSPAARAAGCTSIPYVEAGEYAVPRNVVDFGVTQPGGVKFDMAIAKNFTIPGAQKVGLSENASLQLRVDMLNAFNHPNFDEGYNGDPTSLDWGTIAKGPNGPTNNQRYLQLSAKVRW